VSCASSSSKNKNKNKINIKSEKEKKRKFVSVQDVHNRLHHAKEVIEDYWTRYLSQNI